MRHIGADEAPARKRLRKICDKTLVNNALMSNELAVFYKTYKILTGKLYDELSNRYI